MFFRGPQTPPKPKYRNPAAVEGRRGAENRDLQAWSFGKEIVLYNSRNIYTDGRVWAMGGGGDWVEEAGEEFVEVGGETVFKTQNPRFVWTGWRRGWGSEKDTIRPEARAVLRVDIFPKPKTRVGSGAVYRTRKVVAAWRLWTKLGGVGARWVGDGVLEVEYSNEPNSEELREIGWTRDEDGEYLDINTPLPDWIARGSFFFPGHDKSRWAGVDDVKVKLSGREGCVPSSFTVNNPKVAGHLLKGCECLPAGCRVRVEDRLFLGFFSGRSVPWVEGKVVIPSRRMVPLTPSAQEATIQLDRNAGARFLVDPAVIDYSLLNKLRVATYLAKNGQEKCLITKGTDGLVSTSSVARKSIIKDSGIFYRIITPTGSGGFVSRQKMVGEARARRLPRQNKIEYERLVGLYGDLVEDDYYQHSENYYKVAAGQLAKVQEEGFLSPVEARAASVVPSDVFDRLLAKGMIFQRKISTGRKYLKPVTFAGIQGNLPLIEEIVKIAKDKELDWLCQIITLNHEEFTKALLTVSLCDS